MAINNSQKPDKSPQSKKKAKKKKSKAKKRKRIFRNIGLGLFFCFLSVFVIFAGYAFAIIKTTPPLDVNAVLTLNQPSSLYDSNGAFMDNLHTEEERYVIESSEIPQNLKNAFISIEDERFMKHNGIDIQRIAGAAIHDVKKILTKQKGLHGASTITQQLIKNNILTNDVSIERKVREIYLAVNLEKKLTKDQILTAYLNTIPLGGTAYGVEAASLMYFSKSASDLSLVECAYLAGITQAPTYYSAYTQSDPNNPTYINRTKTVLSMMHQLGYITQDEYNDAINQVSNGGLVFKRSKVDYKMNYEWFVYPAVSQVKKDLKEKYKYTDEEVSKLIVNGGLQIYTTMNRDLQDYTQSTLNEYSNLGVSNAETYDADGVPLLQASATIVNYRTGEVYEESYDTLVLSPGAKPIKPPIVGIENCKSLFTLRNIPDMDNIKSFLEEEKPKRAIVIGGGFIGLEMAENLHEKGVNVTLVEGSNQVMGPLDIEMASIIHSHLIDNGVDLILNDGVEEFKNNGKKVILKSYLFTMMKQHLLMKRKCIKNGKLKLRRSMPMELFQHI